MKQKRYEEDDCNMDKCSSCFHDAMLVAMVTTCQPDLPLPAGGGKVG